VTTVNTSPILDKAPAWTATLAATVTTKAFLRCLEIVVVAIIAKGATTQQLPPQPSA